MCQRKSHSNSKVIFRKTNTDIWIGFFAPCQVFICLQYNCYWTNLKKFHFSGFPHGITQILRHLIQYIIYIAPKLCQCLLMKKIVNLVIPDQGRSGRVKGMYILTFQFYFSVLSIYQAWYGQCTSGTSYTWWCWMVENCGWIFLWRYV